MKTHVTRMVWENFSEYPPSKIDELGNRHPPHEVDLSLTQMATNGVLIERTIFREKGLRFDNSYGLTGGGDIEFFQRAKKAGAVLGQTEDTTIIEWEQKSRRGIRAALRKGFQGGTIKTRLDQAEGHSLARCGIGGAWLLMTGFVAVPIHFALGKGVRKALRRTAKGAGILAGLTGYRYGYYRSVRSSN